MRIAKFDTTTGEILKVYEGQYDPSILEIEFYLPIEVHMDDTTHYVDINTKRLTPKINYNIEELDTIGEYSLLLDNRVIHTLPEDPTGSTLEVRPYDFKYLSKVFYL